MSIQRSQKLRSAEEVKTNEKNAGKNKGMDGEEQMESGSVRCDVSSDVHVQRVSRSIPMLASSLLEKLGG